MRTHKTSLFFVGALSLGQVGCGGTVSSDPKEPPIEFVDDHGRTWIRGAQPVEYTSEAYSDPLPTPVVSEETWHAHRRTKPWTVDELAQNLRGVMLIGDYEYVQAEPDYEGAEAVLRGEFDDRGSLPDYGNAKRPIVDDPLISKTEGIFGTDTRVAQRNNATWPNSAMYLLFKASSWPTVSVEGCSATMIGSSTMITAAHCVYDGDAGKWRSTRGWAGGVDSRDANEFPFTAWHGCYSLTVFGGYDASDDYDDDVAVFEFAPSNAPCGALFPGNDTGWMGIWSAGSGTIENSSTAKILSGYPGRACPPNGTDANCFHPTIWTGQDGYASAEDFLGFDYDDVEIHVDATNGDSGAGLRIKNSKGPGCTGAGDPSCDYVIGVFSGFVSPFIGSDYNVAARTNGRILDFIESNSRWRRL